MQPSQLASTAIYDSKLSKFAMNLAPIFSVSKYYENHQAHPKKSQFFGWSMAD